MEHKRKPSAAVDNLFLDRWSPRAFDPTPLPDNLVKSLFEAARWAPSCVNEQPWLFIYATSEADLEKFQDLLVDGNKVWAKYAPVLAFLFARKTFEKDGKPNEWAKFDSGAAWMSLTVQARLSGLYTHGMAGIHKERVCPALGVPEGEYDPICAIAMGRYGDKNALPEKLREREFPSDRKPLALVAMEGKFRR